MYAIIKVYLSNLCYGNYNCNHFCKGKHIIGVADHVKHKLKKDIYLCLRYLLLLKCQLCVQSLLHLYCIIFIIRRTLS